MSENIELAEFILLKSPKLIFRFYIYSVVPEKLKSNTNTSPSSIPDVCLLRLVVYAEVNHCPLKLLLVELIVHQPKSSESSTSSEVTSI